VDIHHRDQLRISRVNERSWICRSKANALDEVRTTYLAAAFCPGEDWNRHTMLLRRSPCRVLLYRLSQYDTFRRKVFAGCSSNRSRTSAENGLSPTARPSPSRP